MLRQSDPELDRLYCSSGSMLDGKFRVIGQSGEGTFSNVYSCIDVVTRHSYVIKASRSKRCYIDAAEEEVKTMKFLNRIDPNHEHFVRYFGSFVHKSHVCLIFEKLGPSLFSVLQSHRFRPFGVAAVRSFLWQIVSAVDLLHRNKMIHTDLKLENKFLTGNDVDCDGRPDTGLRLIDFGSSDIGSLWHRHLVTTRHYRAPEILMGLRWGYECDIWSIGCILVELALGNIDFDASDPVEHLYLIQEMIGDIPKRMWSDCTREELRQFARDGRIRRDVFPSNVQAGLSIKVKSTIKTLLGFDRELADLALWTLAPDPARRPRCDEILAHEFFR
jgi:dual-specificity kinase